MQHRCLIAAALFAFAGCASFDPRSFGVVMADGIVGEAVQLRRAGSAAEQKAALARADEAMRREATPANRLRLASLLVMLPDPLRDPQRAAELVEPLAEAGDPAYGRFAALIAVQAQEQARLARELARGARDLERERVERDKREEALRQQVEALRDIERGILEREDKMRRREK
ncbi:MAG: hypothetical protein JF611_11155 [Betaproteobacteria bacterium]|nr:hypothetical protein [Betaproteobacteria bacterium]